MTTTSENKGSDRVFALEGNEWETEDFKMAESRLEKAARHLKLEENTFEPLKHPKRSLSVVVPAKMDDGSVRVFAGYRVHHDLSLGPGKGGVRFHPEVTLGEVAAMAMLMTWKCSLMNLPFGGAHGGLRLDPRAMSQSELERVTRRYASEIISFIGPDQDICGPDLNTNEQTMAWMMDTYSVNVGHTVPSVVTGKPDSIGGSLNALETSGYGAATCAIQMLMQNKLGVDNPTVAVQGFGRIGSMLARHLTGANCKIVAACDLDSGVHNPKGMEVAKLIEYFRKNGSFNGCPQGEGITTEEVLQVKCDILAPCAVSNQITTANADKLNCKIIVEGANAPTTPDADEILDGRGITVIPDILANAAGVTVGYFEWVQGLTHFIWTEAEVYEQLDLLVGKACQRVFTLAKEQKLSLRTAAMCLAIERVLEARRLRGLYP